MSATETKTATDSSPAPASDELPIDAVVQEMLAHEVVDHDGKAHALGSLLTTDGAEGGGEAMRVLVVFIRHFYCSFCQDYIRALSRSLPPSRLAALSPSVKVVVIGHGDPALITRYAKETSCDFPIYADGSRFLYDRLGFASNLRGIMTTSSPDYMKRGKLALAWDTLTQYAFGGSKMFASGRPDQNGGELVFRDGKIEWLHRMTTTADHTEVKDLEKLLGA